MPMVPTCGFVSQIIIKTVCLSVYREIWIKAYGVKVKAYRTTLAQRATQHTRPACTALRFDLRFARAGRGAHPPLSLSPQPHAAPDPRIDPRRT